MATISAWAVGSLVLDTLLHPFPTTCPSFTMMQPKGPPFPAFIPSRERSMAIFIYDFCNALNSILSILYLAHNIRKKHGATKERARKLIAGRGWYSYAPWHYHLVFLLDPG